MARSFLSQAFTGFFEWRNRHRQWYQMRWRWCALLNLVAVRTILREQNLYDTSSVVPRGRQKTHAGEARYHQERTADGSFNDLDCPAMGKAGTRFGRNIPLAAAYQDPDLRTPCPRKISWKLMTRDGFKPAESLNLLAAAWVQFMVHDWFTHGDNVVQDPVVIEPNDDDPWFEWAGGPMEIRRTRPDPTRLRARGAHLQAAGSSARDAAPTFLNTETHWWDGSQIYGSTAPVQKRVRSHVGGKLRLDERGFLPTSSNREIKPGAGSEITGVTGNWWVGLGLMHTLFAREHNAICDHLCAAYPDWGDEDLFAHARLINAALIAKIHTLEWTTAILDHPVVKMGMKANWWGLLGERVHRRFGRVFKSDVLSGIPGSETDHHGTPYSITEDFVSVYRMHPLMPDRFEFFSADTGTLLRELPLEKVSGTNARELMEQISMTDLFYSFAIGHPGQLTLNNYPQSLQRLERSQGRNQRPRRIDLAAVDIFRDRERGVPRYNAFRKLIHLPSIKSFEDLTDDHKTLEQLKEVYGDNNVDKLDLMVGLFAEKRPDGFAFSDTAFRIFILMASRRLKSDRFFTTDYRPEVYTAEGLKWIESNDMKTILKRHMPGLRPYLSGADNAFKPWPTEKIARRETMKFWQDIVYVNNPSQAKALNDSTEISRSVPMSWRLKHAIIRRRLYKTLTVNGTPLPVFLPRENADRANEQQRLERDFAQSLGLVPEHYVTEIETLAKYVARTGQSDERDAGKAAQQLAGRLILKDYKATRASYDAARVVYRWLNCANPLVVFWLRITGKLRRAKKILWREGRNNTYCIHAITIAVHNIVDTIGNMRALRACSQDPAKIRPRDAVARCLVAPPRLIRSSTKKMTVPLVARPLKRGTLITLELQEMHEGTGNTVLAFMGDKWNRCPAQHIVTALLEEVWRRATKTPTRRVPNAVANETADANAFTHEV